MMRCPQCTMAAWGGRKHPGASHEEPLATLTYPPTTAMLTATALVIWKLLLPLLVLVAVLDWLTASTDRRVLILSRTGLSQRQIADRLNVTRYRVRQALAS